MDKETRPEKFSELALGHLQGSARSSLILVFASFPHTTLHPPQNAVAQQASGALRLLCWNHPSPPSSSCRGAGRLSRAQAAGTRGSLAHAPWFHAGRVSAICRVSGAARGNGILCSQAAVVLSAQHCAQAHGGAHRLPRQSAEGRTAGAEADRLGHQEPGDPGYTSPMRAPALAPPPIPGHCRERAFSKGFCPLRTDTFTLK